MFKNPEEKEEKEKEETILAKIKVLRKRRNKERGDRRRAEFRCRDKEPAKKKSRVDPMDQGGEEKSGEQKSETEQKPEKPEKRKPEQTGGPKKKQMRIDT